METPPDSNVFELVSIYFSLENGVNTQLSNPVKCAFIDN